MDWKAGPNIIVVIDVKNDYINRIHLEESNAKTSGMTLKINGGISKRLHDEIMACLDSYVRKKKLPSLPPFTDHFIPKFTHNVLKEIESIPFGTVVTYSNIASRLNKPNGARAVGQACGRNPFPLLVPCHRVIASDGSLGGFSEGLDIKKRLLEFEGII